VLSRKFAMGVPSSLALTPATVSVRGCSGGPGCQWEQLWPIGYPGGTLDGQTQLPARPHPQAFVGQPPHRQRQE
jgi:hypothetical protein